METNEYLWDAEKDISKDQQLIEDRKDGQYLYFSFHVEMIDLHHGMVVNLTKWENPTKLHGNVLDKMDPMCSPYHKCWCRIVCFC